MRILNISTDVAGQGGIASVVSNYAHSEEYNSLGVVNFSTHSSAHDGSNLLYFLRSLFRIIPFLLSKDFSLFHIHSASRKSFFRKSIVFWMAKIFRKKTIFHFHGGAFLDFYDKESSALAKSYIIATLSNADKVMVLTNSWKKIFSMRFPRADILTMHNPVFFPGQCEADRDGNTLLYLGRVSKEKGFFDLVRALKLVSVVLPDIQLLYGGDGDIEEADKMLHDFGLSGRAKFLGWVSGSEKRKLLRTSDIFLLPSYSEGLPVGILEAMSEKLPVIATCIGGIPDIITNGETGILIEAGDINSLAEAIIDLLKNTEDRSNMAKNAFDRAYKEFSLESVMPFLVDVYRELDDNIKIPKNPR